MEAELELRAIPFCRAPHIPVHYKDRILASWYEPDFICFGEVIVELKALEAFCGAHEAQVINYLKATGYSRRLLLNFGTERLEYKRLVYTHHATQRPRLCP